eukprot:TRINITY_DN12252_c0_g2_i2.p1 TRINITY_DN12252_c0_g2~~TRINITY_DN12252_c0_g2_i2.p1  ORF type:complete len:442 (+),score=78.31 TRINITY_DN12252_c0_g2_i2:94-1419(+)
MLAPSGPPRASAPLRGGSKSPTTLKVARREGAASPSRSPGLAPAGRSSASTSSDHAFSSHAGSRHSVADCKTAEAVTSSSRVPARSSSRSRAGACSSSPSACREHATPVRARSSEHHFSVSSAAELTPAPLLKSSKRRFEAKQHVAPSAPADPASLDSKRPRAKLGASSEVDAAEAGSPTVRSRSAEAPASCAGSSSFVSTSAGTTLGAAKIRSGRQQGDLRESLPRGSARLAPPTSASARAKSKDESSTCAADAEGRKTVAPWSRAKSSEPQPSRSRKPTFASLTPREVFLPTESDPFALRRFTTEQRHFHPIAVAELKQGAKASCWMWYVMPSPPHVVNGIEKGSANNVKFAIRSDEEARAYLTFEADGVNLRNNYMEILGVLRDQLSKGKMPFQRTDEPKMKSSLKLFERISKSFDAELYASVAEVVASLVSRGDWQH